MRALLLHRSAHGGGREPLSHGTPIAMTDGGAPIAAAPP